MTFLFCPIDLERHAGICVAYRRDSFVASFSDGADRFEVECGSDGAGYLAWLADRVVAFPEGHVHVWENGSIVGQIEASIVASGERFGYVNLYYLAPSLRGCGRGAALDEYICGIFAASGIDLLRLSVGRTNSVARKFYAGRGWVEKGPRPDQPDTMLMEKFIEVSTER